jgi:nucleoside-diphosphate-sugar epimerase
MVEKLTGKRLDIVRDDPRPGDQLIYITDHSKLTRHTGWIPEINLAGTLETIYSWWRHNRDLFADATPVAAASELQERAAS